MIIDIRTLFIIEILLYTCFSLTALYLWLSHKNIFNGINYWVLAFFIQAVSAVLISFRDIVHDIFSIVTSNALIILGHIFYYNGLSRFIGKRPKYFAHYSILTFFVILYVYYGLFNVNLSARIFVVSITISYLILDTSYLAFQQRHSASGNMHRFVSLIFFITGLVHLARFPLTLIVDPGHEFMYTNMIQSASVLLVVLSGLLIAIGFILLITRQLTIIQSQAKADLEDSEKRFKKLAEASFEGIAIHDMGKVLDCNDAFLDIFNYTRGELLGLNLIDLVSPEDQKRLIKHFTNDYETPYELKCIKKNGEKIFAEMHSKKVPFQGKTLSVVAIRDITPRLRTEEELKMALQQRDILIKEIHHRVKNNLGVIQNLLSLQVSQVTGKETKAVLDESMHRINAMIMIHERLYRSSDLSHISFKEYIESLAYIIFNNYKKSDISIKLVTDIPGIDIDIDTIVPCGLIINELLTNSLKYAFNPGDEGEVYVGVENDSEGFMHLIVKDNGKGLPENFDIEQSPSLGMKIVSSLSKQIGAEAQIISGNGTEFRILLLRHTLTPFSWDNKYLTHIAEIDQQINKLADAVILLKNGIISGKSREILQQILPDLQDYADHTLGIEEKYMESYAYPLSDKHITLHNNFKSQLNSVIAGFSAGKNRISLVIYEILTKWFNRHIAEDDCDFGKYIAENGFMDDKPSVRHVPENNIHQYQILMVEDERISQLYMKRMIQNQGYSLQVVSSGEEAIDALKQYQFKLVMSDINVHDMTGYDIVRQIRRMELKIPVILITGDNIEEVMENTVHLNIFRIFSKPVQLEALKKELQNILQ